MHNIKILLKPVQAPAPVLEMRAATKVSGQESRTLPCRLVNLFNAQSSTIARFDGDTLRFSLFREMAGHRKGSHLNRFSKEKVLIVVEQSYGEADDINLLNWRRFVSR